MTTKEVSEKYGVCIAAVARWAKNNGVQRGKPVNGIMPFDWTEDDCRRFEQRPGKGWKKGVPRKKEQLIFRTFFCCSPCIASGSFRRLSFRRNATVLCGRLPFRQS